MDGFTDIREGGWVRHLPRRWIPYAILARFDRPIGAWLLFLPGLWAILLTSRGFFMGVWLTALFAVGSLVMRGAGCVVNDLWDRKMDRLVTRTAKRPLASGILKPVDALAFLAALLTLGLLILVQLDTTARWLGVLSLLPVTLYPLAKRVTWWPQVVLGFTFGWGALMGYAAGYGGLAWPVVPLYAAAIFWILGYDTIYAHQDREDDALIGVKSTARLFGAKTRPFLLVCYGATILLLAVAMAGAHLSIFGILALVLPTGLLVRQIYALDINNPELCLRLFKSNREVGLAVAAAILLGQVT
ncbi:MAG: 4-hydroxybenzoate polyprenyltransferase [Acidocella sp. 20-57-95]|nr:MAG: 4-hydroxybenzoate polyprenyltransferase [Acidocella sp. 20-57-95]OYV59001.1 MAG: 4-hydroxybenzoate polyprenyltransferase [Acidocella sp. 21-58-7]HQT63771.1 4-hydroxybenzoate octaprenyltransferase [Acidocella sp.]HQU05478.1 4-hydroxybenzoate octaprenyltransferase [Acidocella sp.]